MLTNPWFARSGRMVVTMVLDGILVVPLMILSVVSRYFPKQVDVGLGPEPMINNVYHKRALELYGYKAETYASFCYYITDKFDFLSSTIIRGKFNSIFGGYFLFVRAIFRYRVLYIYFNGGPLYRYPVLWRIEPFLLKLAGVKVVVMPYGSDIQDLSCSTNLLFKHAVSKDYPTFKNCRKRVERQVDTWTMHADHVISGCEWVDFLYHWDTLMLAHFSVDTDQLKPKINEMKDTEGPVRILHAPNHRNIKGTQFFIDAVRELKEEGLSVELILLERVDNEKVKEVIASSDIIADQLIMGWYAMFALEGMALGKPVLCNIREDLKTLYTQMGLIEDGELPLVECSPANVKEVIRNLVVDREKIREIGSRSRAFVVKYHSLQAIGAVFDRINKEIGIIPSKEVVEKYE